MPLDTLPSALTDEEVAALVMTAVFRYPVPTWIGGHGWVTDVHANTPTRTPLYRNWHSTAAPLRWLRLDPKEE